MAVSRQCGRLTLWTALLFGVSLVWFFAQDGTPADGPPMRVSPPREPAAPVAAPAARMPAGEGAAGDATGAGANVEAAYDGGAERPKGATGEQPEALAAGASDNALTPNKAEGFTGPLTPTDTLPKPSSSTEDFAEDDFEDHRPADAPKPPERVTWPVPRSADARPPSGLQTQAPWKNIRERQAAEDPRAAVYLLEDIVRNQFPATCQDRNFLVFSISTSATYGFFSVMNQMIGALSAALYLNRTLIFVTRRDMTWMFTDRRECSDAEGTYQAWNCLFEPITNCMVPKSLLHYYGLTKVGVSARLLDWTKGAMSRLQYLIADIVYGRKVFAQLAQNPPLDGPDFLRHTSLLAAFLFRPVQAIVDYKNALKRWLGLAAVDSYIAVHVRRTDKAEEAWLFNAADWVQLVLQYGAPHSRHVFLMTDDAAAVEAMQHDAATRAAGLRFYSSPQLRPKHGATPTILRAHAQRAGGNATGQSRPAFSIVRHGVEFLADCLLAAEAKYFIGSCGSNVDWVIPQLIAAATGKYEANATAHLLLPKTCRYWASEWANDHKYWTNTGKDELRLSDLPEVFARDLLLKSDIKKIRRHFATSGQSTDPESPLHHLLWALEVYENLTHSSEANELDRVRTSKLEINKWLCWLRPSAIETECRAAGLERYHQCGLLFYSRHPSFRREGCQSFARLPRRLPPRPKNTSATFERRLTDYRAHRENLDMCITTPQKRMTNRQKVICVKYKTKDGHWVDLKPVT
eukprot:EG_transcript_3294